MCSHMQQLILLTRLAKPWLLAQQDLSEKSAEQWRKVLLTLHTQKAKVVLSYATIRNGPLTVFFFSSLGQGLFGNPAHASRQGSPTGPAAPVQNTGRGRRVTKRRHSSTPPDSKGCGVLVCNSPLTVFPPRAFWSWFSQFPELSRTFYKKEKRESDHNPLYRT